MEKPYGIPSDFAEHFRLMTDMITVAFQADLTRVVTFLVTREGTSRAYREIGIPDGHHPLTHHRNQLEMMDKVAKINQYQMEQFAQWVTKLKAAQEGNGSILDNSMIVYGAGLSDGNAHTHHDLPDAHRWSRRQQLHQDRPARRLSQGNADVQSVPDDDGPDGHADGSFRRRDGASQRTGSHVVDSLQSTVGSSAGPKPCQPPT